MSINELTQVAAVVVIPTGAGALVYAGWVISEYVKQRVAEKTARDMDAIDPGWRVTRQEFAAQLDRHIKPDGTVDR